MGTIQCQGPSSCRALLLQGPPPAGPSSCRAHLLQAQLFFISKANPFRCVPWTCPSSHISLASDTHMSTNLFMPSLVSVLPPEVLLSLSTACLIEVSPCPTQILLRQTSPWLATHSYSPHTKARNVSCVPQPIPEKPHSSH